MDDLLFVSYEDKSTTVALIALLRTVFARFGVTVSPDKSVLSPVTSLTFLGYTISADGEIALTRKRHTKLIQSSTSLLQAHAKSKRFVTFSSLLKYLGILVSCYEAVPLVRLLAFPLYACLKEY